METRLGEIKMTPAPKLNESFGWTTDVISPFDWWTHEFTALHAIAIQGLSSNARMMNINFANPVWWVAKSRRQAARPIRQMKWPLANYDFKTKDLSEQANSKWFVNMLEEWQNSRSWHKDGKGVRLGPSRQASWYNEEHWKRVWKQIMESRVEFRKGNRIVLKDTKPEFGIDGYSVDDANRLLWSNNAPLEISNKRFNDFYDDIKEVEGQASWCATVDVANGLGWAFEGLMNFDETGEEYPKDNDYTIQIQGPLATLTTSINNRYLVVIRMASDNNEIQKQQIKEIKERFANVRKPTRGPPHMRVGPSRKRYRI